MIIAYTLSQNAELERVEMEAGGEIPQNTVWIDLIEPSLEEEKTIEKALSIEAPTREEMDKIEVTSPFYKEGESYYMTITALNKADKQYPEGTAIIFILNKRCLVTVRYARPKAFSYFAGRAMRNSALCNSPEIILEGLIESMVHSVADVLEKTGNEIDQLLIDVFEKPKEFESESAKKNKTWKQHIPDKENTASNYYTNIIKRVGKTGNLISKIRESLVSINRMLLFFGQVEDIQTSSKKEHKNRSHSISLEIQSLTEYANFLAQRNSFLLDATLGMINVEQNMIIKIFTVAAAVFLPPTLIASIFGMNFKFMPELDWVFGYPAALFLIVSSAILPYYFFKKKGWL